MPGMPWQQSSIFASLRTCETGSPTEVSRVQSCSNPWSHSSSTDLDLQELYSSNWMIACWVLVCPFAPSTGCISTCNTFKPDGSVAATPRNWTVAAGRS